jgi:hypothetical protein
MTQEDHENLNIVHLCVDWSLDSSGMYVSTVPAYWLAWRKSRPWKCKAKRRTCLNIVNMDICERWRRKLVHCSLYCRLKNSQTANEFIPQLCTLSWLLYVIIDEQSRACSESGLRGFCNPRKHEKVFIVPILYHPSDIKVCVLCVIATYLVHWVLSRVGVIYKTGFGLDDWIYCASYIHTFRDYR